MVWPYRRARVSRRLPIVQLCNCLLAVLLWWPGTIEAQTVSLPTGNGRLVIERPTIRVDRIVREAHGSSVVVQLRGGLRNDTSRTWTTARIGVWLYDPTGRLLASTSRAESFTFDIRDLPAGALVPLRVEARLPVPTGTRKEAVSIASSEFRLLGGSYPVRYRIALLAPVPNPAPLFEDDRIHARFDVRSSGIELSITNRLDEPLLIDWSQTSLVDASGQALPIVREGVRAPVQTAIPPRARIVEVVMPHRQRDAMDTPSWLPDGPTSGDAVGQTVGLYLPTVVEGETRNYLFNFSIEAVE